LWKKFFREEPGEGEVSQGKKIDSGHSRPPVCQVARISRTKLSDIERGYVLATLEELQRINDAIEQIVRTRQQLANLAAAAGLCLTGVRL
jgi:hypothetical protein